MHKGSAITLLINTIAKPLQIGFYENDNLIEVKEYDGMTSDILLPILKEILDKYSKEYPVEKIIYTNGPGSHMATKIAYVLLKTLSIIKKIPFYAVSAFELNGNNPIKALGKLYFIKEKETIITLRFDKEPKSSFTMPDSLNSLNILEANEPNYQIAAV